VGDLISELTSKDDVERSKPCPDIFEAALGQADGAKAAEAVVIGDSPFDVKAATKAGIATVAVRSGGFPEPELREAGAVALFDGPEDLLERYSEWAG
jgi:phosphoglycolate phosphatase-like HAD superfamily hydrolase